MATTLPLTYPLKLYTGATFQKAFRWLPGGETGQNFSGWTAQMWVGPLGRTPIVELDTATGGLSLSADGLVTILIEPEQTLDLKSGLYRYNLDLTDPQGSVFRFLRGRFTVERDAGPS